MIKGGFYLKARIQGAGIAHAPPHIREIWDWLQRKAMFRDGEQLSRGQLLVTYDDIREGLSWSVGYRKMRYSKWDCEKAIKWLTKETMITTEKTTRGLIITICKYDEYQNPKSYEITNVITNLRSHYESHNEDHNESHTDTDVEQGTSSDDGDQHDTKATTKTTRKTTPRATREPQCADTIDKNVLKKEIKDLYAPFFEAFWRNYPARNGKKLGKPLVWELFCDLKPCEALLCVHAAKHYADSKMIQDGIGIKDPQRFLISGRGKTKVEFWRDWTEPETKETPEEPEAQEDKSRDPPTKPRWYIGAEGVVREWGTDRIITDEEKAANQAKKASRAANPVLELVREMTV